MIRIEYTIDNGDLDITVDLLEGYPPDEPEVITATQTHSAYGSYEFTGIADGVYTIRFTDASGCIWEAEIQPCVDCYPGYVPVGNICIKYDEQSPYYTSTTYTVVRESPNISYGSYGTLLFSSWNYNGTGTYERWVTPYWRNNWSTDGPMNRTCVWADTTYNFQDIGFSFCVNIAVAKTYYVGFGCDNLGKIKLNGEYILEQDITALSNMILANGDSHDGHADRIPFRYWYIYPVDLEVGQNVIEVFGHNEFLVAAVGIQIYNATPSELRDATSDGDLSGKIVFDSVDLVGDPLQYEYSVGSGYHGYYCDPGYALNTCGESYVCVKRDVLDCGASPTTTTTSTSSTSTSTTSTSTSSTTTTTTTNSGCDLYTFTGTVFGANGSYFSSTTRYFAQTFNVVGHIKSIGIKGRKAVGSPDFNVGMSIYQGSIDGETYGSISNTLIANSSTLFDITGLTSDPGGEYFYVDFDNVYVDSLISVVLTYQDIVAHDDSNYVYILSGTTDEYANGNGYAQWTAGYYIGLAAGNDYAMHIDFCTVATTTSTTTLAGSTTTTTSTTGIPATTTTTTSIPVTTTTTTSTSSTSTTSTTTTTVTTITPSELAACISNSLIVEDTLSFTPPAAYYGSPHTLGSGIVEDANYIFIVFNDSTGGDYKNHVVWRYNKSTQAISTETITTDNAYYNDSHKGPTMLITSSGSLLVAIEELPGTGNHNGPIDIFRWADTSDLTTYAHTTIGNSSTERLAYPFLHEGAGGDIYLEARRYSGTPPYRVFYASTNDGVSFGSMTEYITYGDSDYWIYKDQIHGYTDSDIINYIVPLNNFDSNAAYQYLTPLKTSDFSVLYALDDTNLGSNVTGTELVNNVAWGNTTKNDSFYYPMGTLSYGGYLWSFGYIGTRPAGVLTIDYVQIVKISLTDGSVTTGSLISTPFGTTFGPSGLIVELCDGLYFKAPYNGDMYYYKIESDLSITLRYTETGDYHSSIVYGETNQLSSDFDTVTNKVRVFRFDGTASITTTTTTSSSTTTTTSTSTSSTTTTTTTSPPTTTTTTTEGSSTTTTTSSSTTTTTTTLSPLMSDLISVWEFNETSGTNAVDSYGGNDGTSYNCTVNQTGLTNLTPCYSFNGSTSYVDVPDVFDSYTEGTIAFWVYRNNESSIHDGFAHTYGTGTNNMLLVQIMNSGHTYPNSVHFSVKNASSNVLEVFSNTGVSGSGWHHVAITMDASGSKIYIDGTQDTSAHYTTGSSSSQYWFNTVTAGAETYIARLKYGGTYYARMNGYIDQVVIYSKAKTASEISQLYNSGNGIAYVNW